jgi:hypothetical protein
LNLFEFQEWLCAHGQVVTVDGKGGPQTRGAILAAFSNTCADAVTSGDIAALANRLGCTTKQLSAVAKVESGGSAFDRNGRPKMLFERHKFHKATGGKFGVCTFSNPLRGGYNEDSWDKLARAACCDPLAAFASASWGKFQIMGFHWDLLGYPSSLEMAYATVTGEPAHYDMLGRFIDKNGLRTKLARLSTNPMDNRAFASAYNGPSYRDYSYDERLANAMR